MTNRVTCITKPNRDSKYDAIQMLGGTKEDGGRWACTRQECVDYIKSGNYQFYVDVSGHRVYLIVQKSASGLEYVRTDPDKDTKDNLLSLPECP